MVEASARNEEGFTLVEILCAFAILSLSVVIVLQTIQLASKSAAMASQKDMIARLASEVMLQRRTQPDAGRVGQGKIGPLHWKIVAVVKGSAGENVLIERLRIFHPDDNGYSDFLVERKAAHE